MDQLNQSNSTFFPTAATRIGVCLLYVILCLIGLIGYILYLYVVMSNRKSLSNPFYSLTVSLALPDCLTNLTVLAFGAPAILFTETGSGEEFGPDWLHGVVGFVNDYMWFVICLHMLLIAVNRVWSIRWPNQSSGIFSRSMVPVLIVLSYLAALPIPIATLHCSCTMQFVHYGWRLTCDPNSAPCTSTVLMADSVVTNTQIAFVLLSNAFVLFHVYRKGRKVHNNANTSGPVVAAQQRQHFKRERGLAVQFTAVAAVLIVGQCAFWILPPFLENDDRVSPEIGGVVNTVISIMTFSLNPFLYFIFSSEIRKRLFTKGGNVGAKSEKYPEMGIAAVANSRQPARLALSGTHARRIVTNHDSQSFSHLRLC